MEILIEKLKQIFAKTEAALAKETSKEAMSDKDTTKPIWRGFLKETAARATDSLEDVAYQFPAYLRLQNKNIGILQAAHFEWLKHSRGKLDFGKIKNEIGILQLNSALETLLITEGASILGLTQGAYAIYSAKSGARVQLLTKPHAEMLEVLREGDRKFSREQVIEWMENPQTSWNEILSDLIKWEIVS